MKGLAIAFIVLLIIGYSVARGNLEEKKIMRRRSKAKFGEIPDGKTEDFSLIRFYMDNYGEDILVDDITWEDLSMNLVFGRINNCDSSAGEEILYHRLHQTGISDQELERMEQAAGYFDVYEAEREKVSVALTGFGKRIDTYYIPAYMADIGSYSIGKIWLFRILQVILAAAAIGSILAPKSIFPGILLASILFNIVIYSAMKMKYEIELNMLGTISAIPATARKILNLNLSDGISRELKDSMEQLKKTSKKIGKLQVLKNVSTFNELGVLQDYVMGIFLWQLTTYEKVIKRLEGQASAYMELYRILGEVDMAVSIASFRRTLPGYTIPEFWKEKKVEAEGLYHPLLKEPVSNSLDWEKNCLVTGSNASGKSTFIKAMAVNLILAQSIHTCAAQKLKMPRTDILTSMAVRDDITSGESYFIKEIRYLQRMLEHLNDEKCTVCIIDEILRGTNTRERIASSQAILTYLTGENCMVMAASHDQELTSLLEGQYDNYHFSEVIGETDIRFDYKMYPGPAVSGNAIRLLAFAGFPEEIIKQAEKSC